MTTIEAEALRRAQEIHSRTKNASPRNTQHATNREQSETSTNPTNETPPQSIRNESENSDSVLNKGFSLSPLFEDKEKLLILLLILILISEDESDTATVLALLYLII